MLSQIFTFTGLTTSVFFFPRGRGLLPQHLACEVLMANDEGCHLFSQHMTCWGYLYIKTVSFTADGCCLIPSHLSFHAPSGLATFWLFRNQPIGVNTVSKDTCTQRKAQWLKKVRNNWRVRWGPGRPLRKTASFHDISVHLHHLSPWPTVSPIVGDFTPPPPTQNLSELLTE